MRLVKYGASQDPEHKLTLMALEHLYAFIYHHCQPIDQNCFEGVKEFFDEFAKYPDIDGTKVHLETLDAIRRFSKMNITGVIKEVIATPFYVIGSDDLNLLAYFLEQMLNQDTGLHICNDMNVAMKLLLNLWEAQTQLQSVLPKESPKGGIAIIKKILKKAVADIKPFKSAYLPLISDFLDNFEKNPNEKDKLDAIVHLRDDGIQSLSDLAHEAYERELLYLDQFENTFSKCDRAVNTQFRRKFEQLQSVGDKDPAELMDDMKTFVETTSAELISSQCHYSFSLYTTAKYKIKFSNLHWDVKAELKALRETPLLKEFPPFDEMYKRMVAATRVRSDDDPYINKCNRNHITTVVHILKVGKCTQTDHQCRMDEIHASLDVIDGQFPVHKCKITEFDRHLATLAVGSNLKHYNTNENNRYEGLDEAMINLQRASAVQSRL